MDEVYYTKVENLPVDELVGLFGIPSFNDNGDSRRYVR